VEPLVSIVVPVYKVEKYLDTCVQSIMNQTYRNFELILVDDGSPDHCPELCDEYARMYTEIKVLHKENGGLSDARNAGISVANGDLVTFIDSDDYVNPMYLRFLVNARQITQSDISACAIRCVSDSYSSTLAFDESFESYRKVTGREALEDVLYQKSRDVSANGILLPILLAKRFLFPKGRNIEDLFTTYHYYLSSKFVSFVDLPLYYYLQRNGSIMHIKNDKFFSDLIDASNKVVEACKDDSTLKRAAIHRRFGNYRSYVLDMDSYREKYPRKYQGVIDVLTSDKWEIIKDKNANWKNKISALALILGLPGLQMLRFIKRACKNGH
jgi:glycosyltransferase involved in cell wall biosynthesis